MRKGYLTVVSSGAAFSEKEVIWKSSDDLVLKALSGKEASAYWKEIACLRVNMFKEFPYLYEGSFDNEKKYLNIYFDSERSVILLVFDKNKLVGFSSLIPLDEEMVEIKKPFIEKGLNVESYLYIGEVMIKSPYQGKGLLRRFLEYHESQAKEQGYSHLVFMTVIRPFSHPLRPVNDRSLDPVWRHFGYRQFPEIKIKMMWKQIDTHRQEENELAIWIKNVS